MSRGLRRIRPEHLGGPERGRFFMRERVGRRSSGIAGRLSIQKQPIRAPTGAMQRRPDHGENRYDG
jgi:hypothetical protein